MLKVNVGCGYRKLPGFVNIDCRGEVSPERIAHAWDLPFVDTDSVDVLYSSHTLEHVRRKDIDETLREWFRVLKPGGHVYISVPDLRTLFQLYVLEGVTLPRLMGLLFGRQDYVDNTHYCGWDYETLAYALTCAGFFDIREFHPADVLPPAYQMEHSYHDLAFARINEKWVSLNVAATKP